MKSLHPNLTRRGLLAAFAGLASGLAVGTSAGPVAAATSLGTAVILGDAFSAPTYSGVKSWATQLANKGLLTVAANLAKAGALASAPSGPLSLLGQVDAYLATRPTLPDFTIVYFGTEDLQQGKSLSTAESNYLQAVKKLIAAGANAGSKRLVLVQIHDVSRDPGVDQNVRANVVSFNKFIQRTVGSRPNLLTVNLGVFFDKVFQNPAAYHLTNVTTPDPANSGSTALYFDSTHFGKKGQWLIAAEVKRILSAK